MALPAGSVAVTEIAFDPSASGRTTWKAPVPSATPIAVRPLASLRARDCWTCPASCPAIVTEVPLTVALSSGDEMAILGFVVSRTYVTIGDASLSPPGPTTVAEKSLRPGWSVTSGIAKLGVSPSGNLADLDRLLLRERHVEADRDPGAPPDDARRDAAGHGHQRLVRGGLRRRIEHRGDRRHDRQRRARRGDGDGSTAPAIPETAPPTDDTIPGSAPITVNRTTAPSATTARAEHGLRGEGEATRRFAAPRGGGRAGRPAAAARGRPAGAYRRRAVAAGPGSAVRGGASSRRIVARRHGAATRAGLPGLRAPGRPAATERRARSGGWRSGVRWRAVRTFGSVRVR